MKTLVLYDSHSGNTQHLAETIAETLRPRGEAEVMSVTTAPMHFADDIDLVLIGGPTEAHGATPAIIAFFDGLAPNAMSRVNAAAFDTRLGWPKVISGSAASKIADRLTQAGARLVAPPESFIVSRAPELESGEVEHAISWATSIADSIAGTVLVPMR